MANYTVAELAGMLADARRLRGFTQQQLADLLGVPQSYVAKVETGKTDIRTSKLMEIARLLDLEVLFVPKDQMPMVRWALADDREMNRRQLHEAAYEPDEDDEDDDEEEL